ncbi:MAG TPA: hypothetical protein VJT69_09740 [Pyrinomonadaceae bacterium]|nr:hypothetical protein [Pyrinomonadaceae bacterium]
MNSKFYFLSLLFLVLFSAQTAFATEPTVEEMRSMGPAGLQMLMTRYAGEINRHITNPSLASDEEWQRITTALDTVAQQKNSYISGLYWYTDFESAKRASAASGKPILSLRLLGKLTDEFSCANSRFFRTVLYPNAEVSSALRDRFVLHWESVRPVPTVTIDFGDGRKLERTLTGNSIHYILDSDGRPIEALPGLYGPKAFLRGLANAETLFKSLAGKNDEERNLLLTGYYRQQHNKLSAAWTSDTDKIGDKPERSTGVKAKSVKAIEISGLAMTKAITEFSVLRAMTAATERLGRITDEAAWTKIAQLHAPDAMLDERSKSLIKRQNPALTDQELSSLVQKFQELIALDTVRNEYLLHSKLYILLVEPIRNDMQKLNEQVYAELFQTPRSDPWLGLFSTDLYTALDNGGVVKPH